jgi:hypothetical protein
VLPLGDALERLYRKALPPRSVAITFDDGTYDFYRQAYPRLKQHKFPATVISPRTTATASVRSSNLICPYMMWKVRDRGIVDLAEFGVSRSLDLASAEARREATLQLAQWAERRNLTGEQKDQAAATPARRLQIDYQELCAKRILQLMNRQEVRQLVDAGVDFQLHTHRHRTPLNEELFRREIRGIAPGYRVQPGALAHISAIPAGCTAPNSCPGFLRSGPARHALQCANLLHHDVQEVSCVAAS